MEESKDPLGLTAFEWIIGERYFLPHGSNPFTLLSIVSNKDHDSYTCQLKYESCTIISNRVHTLHKAIKTDKKENDMNNLYEFTMNDKQLFGTKIAVNSAGLWVMEVKGSGDVVTVDKDKVEEVIPHTIGVRFLGNGPTYHYFAPKGKFNKGFYLFSNQNGANLVEVSALDTKSKQATREFTPTLKFVTEAIDSSSDT